VLTLLARGLATKQLGRTLGVTTKTADHYVQQVYAKIGVSTRAAAAVYAMQHGLATWENSR
jgi:DNA-binding NarL/FixJ family response regulator